MCFYSSKIAKFIKTENRMVVARSWGGIGEWGMIVNGYSVTFTRWKKFWRWMLMMVTKTWMYLLKCLKWLKFMGLYFTPIFKNEKLIFKNKYRSVVTHMFGSTEVGSVSRLTSQCFSWLNLRRERGKSRWLPQCSLTTATSPGRKEPCHSRLLWKAAEVASDWKVVMSSFK